MSPSVVSVFLMVLVVGAASLWVLEDVPDPDRAGSTRRRDLGGLTVDRPEVWAALCLLALVLFLPLYLVARRSE